MSSELGSQMQWVLLSIFTQVIWGFYPIVARFLSHRVPDTAPLVFLAAAMWVSLIFYILDLARLLSTPWILARFSKGGFSPLRNDSRHQSRSRCSLSP